LKIVVSRQNDVAGAQVHRRLDGSEVRRPGDPGPASHVGGERLSNADDLSAVDGLRSNGDDRGPRQEERNRSVVLTTSQLTS